MAGRYKAYPEYKDSGVAWLGEVPVGWDRVPLKYMALGKHSLFLDGDWIESKDLSDGGIRYITTGSVGVGEFKEQGAGFISEDKFMQLGCTEVFEGDVLISRLNAPIGRSCVVPFHNNRIVTSVDNVIFRPDKEFVKEFLVYLFSSAEYFVHTGNLARGATMQRISRGLLGNVRAVIPSLPEQKQIARFLDHETGKIDALIEKQQALIALLQEKRQAVISHAVTKGLNPDAKMKDSGVEWLGQVPEHWEVKKVKNLAYLISKGTTPSTIGGDFVDQGIRFLKAENVGKSLHIEPKPYFYITKQVDALISRSRLKEHDVLVIIAGATTGLASIVTFDLLPANTNQAVSFIRPKKPAYSKFIVRWLSTEFSQRTIWIDAVQAAQPNLSMEDLGNISISLPPINELENIMKAVDERLDRFESLIAKAESAIELMQERRTALISAAVTGKIDVRDWEPAPEAQSV